MLEARACGATVITSDLPEPREAGGEGGIYIESTEDGIRNGIGILMALKKRPAEGFDWRDRSRSKSAAILVQVLLGRSHTEGCFARHHEAASLAR